MAKPRIANLPNSYRLWRSSLATLVAHKKLFGGVALVSAIVNLLIGLAGPDFSVYQGLWFIFSFAAFSWSLRHHDDKKAKPGVRQAYYEGTAGALKIFLIFVSFSISLLPFSVGAFIYSAWQAVSGGQPSFVEQTTAVVIWLGLALASFYLIARLMSAVFIVSLPDVWPGTALRASWRLTSRRSLQTTSRFIGGLAGVLALALLLAFALSLLNLSTGVVSILQNVFSAGLIIPLLICYLFKLYNCLR